MIEGANCPKCGGPLQAETFTDVWDADNKPSEIYDDPYCPACKLRWVAMDTEPDARASTKDKCPDCGGPATHPSGLCRDCYQGKLESEEI